MNNQFDSKLLDDQRAYYDSYWKTHKLGLIPDEVTRLAEILQAVAVVMAATNKKELKICDLGCGRGWLSAELSKFGKVTAVDLSPQAVQAAKERWPHVNFTSADILAWRPDESFDLVVSSEVIEHVPDHGRFADTVKHLLRDGGYLILTTPNGKVKNIWDAMNGGSQIIENWLTPSGLRNLFSGLELLSHKVFILDFSCLGIFRVVSAPKILKILKKIGLLGIYNAIRESMGLGLYQIIVSRTNKVK